MAPRAYYGVGRVLQEFGQLGSTAGVLASVVHRDRRRRAVRWPICRPRNALALAGNTLLRFKRRRVRVAPGRRRIARERHGGGHRAGAAIERPFRPAARPHLLAARPAR